jgi:hypothetical protein
MKVRAELTVEVLRKDGERIYRLRTESKSLLQNFAKVFGKMLEAPAYMALSSGGINASTTVINTAGASTTAYIEYYGPSGNVFRGGGTPMGMNAADNDDSFGVVVGSGSTPVSPTDYALAAKIGHGTGSGQLDYGPATVTSSYGATSSYAEIARTFLNASGADVTVREVGIIARSYWKLESGIINDVRYLIARDTLPSPVKVPNLGTLTVRYRVSLSL